MCFVCLMIILTKHKIDDWDVEVDIALNHHRSDVREAAFNLKEKFEIWKKAGLRNLEEEEERENNNNYDNDKYNSNSGNNNNNNNNELNKTKSNQKAIVITSENVKRDSKEISKKTKSWLSLIFRLIFSGVIMTMAFRHRVRVWNWIEKIIEFAKKMKWS
jgi:hypothetical protein